MLNMDSIKKIGIMGGTFDPIHNAHLALAEAAYEQLSLDCVMFIPACQPPHKIKAGVSPADIRAQMVKSAIKDNPHFTFSDIELNRTGNSYTADTLTELHEQIPDAKLYFILGADSLFAIDSWSRPDEIMAKSTLAAAVRDNKSEEEMKEQINYLKKRYNADIRLLSFPDLDISSHELRHIRSENRSVRYLVPEEVNDYIVKNGLYLKQG